MEVVNGSSRKGLRHSKLERLNRNKGDNRKRVED